MEDPSRLTDTTFWTFTTEFGDIDVVLRPAGFPHGYEDLINSVVIVRLADEADPGLGVDAVVADVSAIYTSKRLAGRRKDIESLPAFTGIHPTNEKDGARQRYLVERARRSVLVAGSWIFTDLARRGRRRRRPSSARRPVRVAEDDRVVDCQAERRRCGPGSGDRSGKPCRLRRVSILALLCSGTPPAGSVAWRLVPGDQLSCAVDSAQGDGAVG